MKKFFKLLTIFLFIVCVPIKSLAYEQNNFNGLVTSDKFENKVLIQPLKKGDDNGKKEVAEADCTAISDITLPAAHIIMIAAPILLVILTTIDLFGVVTSGDEKNMKKCISNLIKRFIICVIILILPLLINLIIGWTTFKDLTACFK